MSGGIAYVLDPNQAFPDRCNKGMVELETVDTPEEAELVRSYIEEHVAMTGSVVGKRVLDDWENSLKHFVKVRAWGAQGPGCGGGLATSRKCCALHTHGRVCLFVCFLFVCLFVCLFGCAGDAHRLRAGIEGDRPQRGHEL
jgi:hypothetical protein